MSELSPGFMAVLQITHDTFKVVKCRPQPSTRSFLSSTKWSDNSLALAAL
jgi:hypothetical protein